MILWSICPTGEQIWGRYTFLWLFCWFQKWHFTQFWHISSTFWRIFFEWVSKSNLLPPVSAFNLTYWRANFEFAILFYVFFLGSKSDISGSFGTLLADIGGFFLNELTKHFTSNLLFSFLFLRSVWPTREEFWNSLSFGFTFFFFKKQKFWPFRNIFSTDWNFFLNEFPNHSASNFFLSFVFLPLIQPREEILKSPSVWLTFFL